MLRRLLVCAIATVACGGFAAAAQAATPPLYVSLTFDDGLQGDIDYAMPALQEQGFKGTFYVNSGTISATAATRQNDRMTWGEVQQLQSAQMEIGGHTTDHSNLVNTWTSAQYTTDAQRTAAVQAKVCADHDEFAKHGIAAPVSFAYPNGAFELPGGDRQTIPTIVKGCGYTSARTTSGIALNRPNAGDTSGDHCDVCYAPLSDRSATPNRPYQPFGLRASQARGSQIAAEGSDDGTLPAQSGNDDIIPLSTLQNRTQFALDALQHPKPTDLPNPAPADGGWLVIVLHDVCKDANTAPCGPGQSDEDRGHSTTRDTLRQYLAWLKTQTATGCVYVATVGQMISAVPPTTCQPATDPGTGGGNNGGGGTGGGNTGGGGGGAATPTTTPVATPVADTPAPVAEAPAPTPTPQGAASVSPQPAATTVRLLTPSARLLAKGTVGFRAVVNAPAGVKRVEFLVDGKVVGTAKSGSYRFSWSPKAGKKTKVRTVKVSVRVIDKLGRVVQSGPPVTLKVRLAALKAHR
jgi:peptidoglycan/xylan/chitin deacetylase (PgdA/CDA1 family)